MKKVEKNVEKAIDERSSISVIGDVMSEYTQYQVANAIRESANNQNNGTAEVGVGLGAGMFMGQTMSQVFANNINQQNNQKNTNSFKCPKCSTDLPNGAKFCMNCGTKIEVVEAKEVFCIECGTKNPSGSKFCFNCGKKF